MGRNLVPKVIMIVVLAVVAFWTLYPPNKTLTPGIDLAGGTSLIWEIDAQGLDAAEKKDLSARMITVLRRRIDPANIQNLVWRPQGNTRFEIQMPLASAEAIEKRLKYKEAKRGLLAENVNIAMIMRSLQKSPEVRAADFERLAHGSASRLVILTDFATAYDEREGLRKKRDDLTAELRSSEEELSAAGVDLEGIKSNRVAWMGLDKEKLAEELKDFLGSENEERVDSLARYVEMFGELAGVGDELTEPESGKIAKYEAAKREINKLNFTEEQIEFILEKPVKSRERKADIQKLRTDFADRVDKIDRVVEAFDEYRPFRGRLDDPEDLRRMLKGAGILEFRVLPTRGRTELTADEIDAYVEALTEKGPKYASDNKYTWCELESVGEWVALDEQGRPFIKVRDAQEGPAIVAPFGDKYYVLASSKKNETLLHSAEDEKAWKLEKARPTQDRMGRRAIGFKLNERAGKLFSGVTGANIGRPLCILLDEIAISAPNIQDRIRTEGIITGNFSQTEVEDMVNKLNAGSLPAMLIEQPILIKTIGPSIGADNRDQGIKAGLIGLVAVVLCMAVYYTLAGSIADLALLMNLLFVLATMALIRATFTLPGIAGIILTIGMSVDANVLIFERIREEQQKGSSLRIAIRNGYQRAFRTIFDANLTTFITAAILYWRASEEVKGFAIVLMLGIMSSMFTALFVTRVVFDILLGRRIIKDHLLMLRIIRQPKVDWMRLRPVLFGISALLIAGGLFVFFTRTDKYDIEFTGGTSAQLNLKEALERQEVEDRIREVGGEMSPALGAAKVYSIGESGKQYEINTTETNKTTST
ncbi:MAG: protein translocase subunit SecD, partial [Planctomycetota bacterium]